MTRNERLQAVCRDYLSMIRSIAVRFGLGGLVDGLISSNLRGECAATEDEVAMLSRAVDDERLSRRDVPKVLGQSYRQCVESGLFERMKTLKRVGIYSKLSVLLSKKD